MNIKKALIGLAVFALAACVPQRVITNETGKRGELRDAIYSVEPRANGAYVMWLRYDGEGVYCTTDKALYDKAKQIMHEGTGWANVEYYTLYGTPDYTFNSCYNVETTGNATHTVYIMTSVTETKNQQ